MNKRKAEAKYRLALSTAIIGNRHAVYRALVSGRPGALDVQLAEFVLEEARWAPADFLRAYLEGELDG